MSNVNEFISRLTPSAGRDIYVWGGQGKVTSRERIKKYETSAANVKRALKLYEKRLLTFPPQIILEYDCSGYGTKNLMDMGVLARDINANGLLSKCSIIQKAQLKRGDQVFRTYKTGSKKGQAYHVGYVIDDELHIAHAKGRNDGVVIETLNANGAGWWNTCGRPLYFADEINAYTAAAVSVAYSRMLYYKYSSKTKEYACTGADVKAVQQALVDNGYSPGSIDGVFGKNTRAAVIKYQRAKKLKVDGVVGPKTWAVLIGA